MDSSGSSGAMRILMPSKLDPMEMYPKATISMTISVLVQHPDEGFPKGRHIPNGALAANTC